MTVMQLFPNEAQKYCPSCKDTKSLRCFWKGQAYCIDCQKEKQKNVWTSRSPKKRLEQHLKFKYGISHTEFMEAWNKQDGSCAICEGVLPDLMVYENRRRGYAIDHNHQTHEFRGILCLKCNSLLGINDSADILLKAISYLKEKGSYDNMRAARTKSTKG